MQNTDGSLLFDTAIDNSGFNNGINNLNIIADNAIANIASNMIGNISNAAAQIPQQMVAVGSNFEASMSQVAATMGITAATEEYKKLSAAAKEMGETTKFSASQAGEALNYLALAGYDTNKSIAALPTILNTAAAGGMELAAASDMITDAMSALGLETSQMSDFSDKLAVTAQKSNTSVAQLGEAILTVGGTAKSLSGGVTEMNTVLGILADNGIKGAEGGTALRNVILSLTAPTSTAADAISALGLTVYDNSGKLRSLQDILADLSAELATMSDADKNQALSDIFNKVDLKSVNALLGTSAERFGELTGYINDCSGAAARMAETMDNNLKGDITILQSGLEGLGIAAYEKFATPMRTAVKDVTSDVSVLTDSLTNGELSQSFDTIANGFSKIVAGGADVLSNNILPKLITGFSWITDNFDIIAAGAGAASVAVVSYKIATEGATVAQIAFNAAANLNPYVLIGSAIAGAVTAIGIFALSQDNVAEKANKAQKAYVEQANAVNEINIQLDKNQKRLEELQAISMPTYADRQEIANIQSMNEELRIQLAIEKEILATRQTEAENTAVKSLELPMETYRSELSEYEKDLDTLKDLQQSYDKAISDGDTEAAQGYEENINNMSATLLREKSILLASSENVNNLAENLNGFTDAGAKAKESISALNKELYTALNLRAENPTVISWNGNDTAAYYAQLYTESQTEFENNLAAGLSKQTEASAEIITTIKEEWKRAEHEYATGDIATEQALYAEKLRIWNEYGDASLEDHWTYYEDLAKYRKDHADNAAEAEKAAMDNEWKSIANAENLGLMSAEEAYKKRLEFIQKYCPEYSDEWAAYYQDVYNYQQNEADKSLELQRDSLTNQADELKDGLNNILSTYKSAFSDLEAMKSSYKNKLLSVGDAFSVTENADGSKTAKVNDLRKQMSEMKKYHAYIKKLKAEGVSSWLLQELVSMDWEEGMVFAEQLSAMSSADFGEINGYYNERDKLAQSLAEELYAPEAAQLNTNLQTDIMTKYQALPPALQVTGAEAYNAFITGMQTAAGNVSFDVDKLINTLDTQLTTAISNMDLSDCIAALSESSDAYSAGKTMGDNFVSGFKDVFDDMIATAFGEQTKLAAELSINNKSTSDKTNGAEKIVIENNIHTDVNLDGKKVTETVNKTNNIIDREKGK